MTRKRYHRPGVVDLGAVREARKRLRELADKYPPLRGESGQENVDGWIEDLKEIEQDGDEEENEEGD